MLEIDDAFFKVTDDGECGMEWNVTEGEELSRLLNSMGHMPRDWVPTESQRAMCDHDTNRRIAKFAPWSYSPSDKSKSSGPAGSATPYYSRSAASAPAPAANSSSAGFATEFHDVGGDRSDGSSDSSSDGIHGGDDGALFVSTLADGHRSLSPAQLASYRARLGHFLAAFARVDSDGSRREPDPPLIVRQGHRHVYTGRRGRGPFDYESELDRDRPEP